MKIFKPPLRNGHEVENMLFRGLLDVGQRPEQCRVGVIDVDTTMKCNYSAFLVRIIILLATDVEEFSS